MMVMTNRVLCLKGRHIVIKLILYDVDKHHISTFTDVKPACTFCPIKGVLTWERFTFNFLRTTFMLTVNV